MRSDREWRQWGRRDPLWAVLTTPGRHAAGERPWTEEEVMAQGRAAFPAYLDQWRRYGLSTDSCLEIGCGVGRMTAQLLDVFDEVHAVDVSEEMLSKARVLVPGATYHLVHGSELPEVRTTAVFSTRCSNTSPPKRTRSVTSDRSVACYGDRCSSSCPCTSGPARCDWSRCTGPEWRSGTFSWTVSAGCGCEPIGSPGSVRCWTAW